MYSMLMSRHSGEGWDGRERSSSAWDGSFDDVMTPVQSDIYRKQLLLWSLWIIVLWESFLFTVVVQSHIFLICSRAAFGLHRAWWNAQRRRQSNNYLTIVRLAERHNYNMICTVMLQRDKEETLWKKKQLVSSKRRNSSELQTIIKHL